MVVRPPTCIQVQRVWPKAPPGIDPMNPTATIAATSAERPTEPTPTRATTARLSPPPKRARMMKPANGSAGTIHNRSSISPSHPADSVGIQVLRLVEQLKNQG